MYSKYVLSVRLNHCTVTYIKRLALSVFLIFCKQDISSKVQKSYVLSI